MSGLVADGGVAAFVHDRRLLVFDARGLKTSEIALARPASHVARFGDEWLVLSTGDKRLGRASEEGGKVAPFAEGRSRIDAFAVGRDDAVAIARTSAVELWSRDAERRWSAKGGPFLALTLTRDHLVALDAEGALVFFDKSEGKVEGALRLASPEAPETWRLAYVDGQVVVLALGEWLVWIDTAKRKTVRRVRASARVVDLSADVEHVVAVVEDGVVQAFRATSGEPGASFSAHDGEVRAVALAREVLFTAGSAAQVHTCDRQTLDVTTRATSPVSAIAARGEVLVVGDRAGAVRVLSGDREREREREVGTFAVGDAATFVHITRDEAVLTASSRIALRSSRPWQSPQPIALRAPSTAIGADDAYLFAGSASGAVEVYDLEEGRHITTYSLSSDDRITAIARLAGPLLVVGTGALDGRVFFVDVVEAKVVHRVSPHEEAFGVTCLSADSRGRIVASGSDDGSVALLDPAKGRVLARLRVSETPVSLAFEPSGRRLACVFADGTAAVITLTAKGASLADLGLRGATQVAWADRPIFGFRDGRTVFADASPRPPSVRPSPAGE